MSDIVRYSGKEKNVVIIVDRDLCKGCDICVKVCKPELLKLVDAPDRWEGAIIEVTDPDLCTFCRLCELQCPDFAIRVVRKEEEDKIHVGGTRHSAAER